MEGRDRAECQNWEKKGHNGHFEFVLNDNKTKVAKCRLFQTKEKRKRGKGKKSYNKLWISFSRERVSSFSLGF